MFCNVKFAWERMREWQSQLVVVKLDVSDAFGSIPHLKLFQCLCSRLGPRPACGWMKLITSCSLIPSWAGASGPRIRLRRGCRQGQMDVPLLWALVLDEILTPVITGWTEKGWGLILPGDPNITLSHQFFADDLILLAVSMEVAQLMVSELVETLEKWHLFVAREKVEWMSVLPTERDLVFQGQELPPVMNLEILGTLCGHTEHAYGEGN